MQIEPNTLPTKNWREELQIERKKSEDFQFSLKNNERTYQMLINELKTQLQAEQQKTSSLQSSLKKVPFSMTIVQDLQTQLKQSELKQKSLIEENNQKIKDLENQLKEALSTGLSSQFSEFKDFAIAEITIKEKIIIEQRLVIEKSEQSIKSLTQEISKFPSLLEFQKQKHKNKKKAFKKRVDDLENEIREICSFKEDPEEKPQKNQHEINKNFEDQTQDLKLQIENLLEELGLKNKDLKNAEKKISQLKDTCLSLAETIRTLEHDLEKLQCEKREIIKGLEGRDETIHILEEELNSTAINLNENYKEDLSKANEKCKRLEKHIKDSEEYYESHIQEKLSQLAKSQLKINEMSRKVQIYEKERENLIEKIKLGEREKVLFECQMTEYKKNCEKENEKLKEKLKEKITSLKTEREELRLKINELQETSNMTAVSDIEPGRSLFDELAQISENFYTGMSTKGSMSEGSKTIETLIADLAEKEASLKNMRIEKNRLEEKLKENAIEAKSFRDKLAQSTRVSRNLADQLELAKWELDSLRSDKSDKGKILTLESEKELLLAEKSRLETELVLSKENWAELNNSLYNDLLESQSSAAQVKSELLMLKENISFSVSLIEDKPDKKKKSWFSKKK